MRRNDKASVEARRAEWRGRLQAEMDRIADVLSRRPDVRKVIVFGSMARGETRWRSDLDLVIVQRTGKRFLDRLGEFYGALAPRVGTDLLVYTPEEWEELRQNRAFQRRIDREGKVLYDARSA